MPKIRILNDRTGEVKEIDCVGYNLQYVTADGNGQIQKIRALNNGKYSFKHWIKNDVYYPIALKIKQNLMKQVPDFSSINIERILDVQNIKRANSSTHIQLLKTDRWGQAKRARC